MLTSGHSELPAWHLQLSLIPYGHPASDPEESETGLLRALQDICAVHVLGQAKFDRRGISRLTSL